jgi:hypothetical protein
MKKRRKTSRGETEGTKYNGDDHHKQRKKQRYSDVHEEESARRFG